ncbi:MAG TPA: hypothetical protein VG675_16515 [Bryobacteraceae bacterium]|nr:hypothetical protein [Bryobacteraceae bacterium]
MNARILAVAFLVAPLVGTMPAADSQLLSLVMPDAKVVAGLNVTQALSSPFGQYLLTHVPGADAHFQALTALTGFDPTRDVTELLLASNGAAGQKSGLVLARGNFDAAKIGAAAQQGGALTETYNGVTIWENPRRDSGVAFLDSSLAAAGDITNVKAAIDRRTAPSLLAANLATRVNQWSTSEDAWMVTTVSPESLKPQTGTQPPPNGVQNVFKNVTQASAGVKFGAIVTLNAEARADNSQDATSIANVLQFLASMVQSQAKNPDAAAALKSLVVNTQGETVKLSLSVPQEQIEKLIPQRQLQHRGGAARSRSEF